MLYAMTTSNEIRNFKSNAFGSQDSLLQYNIKSHHMLTSCYEIDLQMIDIKYNVKIEHLIELDLYIYMVEITTPIKNMQF